MSPADDEPLFDLIAYARRLRVAMAEDALSFRDAAPLIGVSSPTLNRICRAAGLPDVENYLRIERWFAERERTMSEPPKP